MFPGGTKGFEKHSRLERWKKKKQPQTFQIQLVLASVTTPDLSRSSAGQLGFSISLWAG